jgi:Fe-S cluster assembly ATP-binding protein
MTDGDFREFLHQKMKLVQMKPEYLERPVNVGFSGGEKKRNEILQMAVLDTKLSILDETDSGLDIDALKIVAKGINSLSNESNAIILITHYQRLLDYIEPTFIHVMQDGKIIKTGDKSLAKELENNGYDWLN